MPKYLLGAESALSAAIPLLCKKCQELIHEHFLAPVREERAEWARREVFGITATKMKDLQPGR